MIHSEHLQEIEQELARRGHGLRFQHSLERAFQHAFATQRNRSSERYLICYLFANLFCLLCDYQAGGRAFHLGLIFRVALFTPLILASVMILRSQLSARTQCLSAMMPLLFDTVFVTLLARATPQPFTDRYLLGAAVGIMAQILLVPVPLLFSTGAFVGATGILAALSLLPLGRGFFQPVTPDLVLFVGGVGLCFLYQRYTLEQSARRDFLLSEANRLRMEQVLAANAHLERLSSIDSLTGVFNRRYLDAALACLWRLAAENKRWIAVLMVDIDHFKQVNDTHGHQHGDFCLEHVAQTLQGTIRAGVDTVARYGGEEFVALLPDADESEADEIASRVRTRVEDLGLLSHSGCVVTVSIGVAALRGGSVEVTLPDFIAAADSALYQAKSGGRNRVIKGSQIFGTEPVCSA